KWRSLIEILIVTASSARTAGRNTNRANARAEIPSPFQFMRDCLISCSFHATAMLGLSEFKLELKVSTVFFKVRKIQRPWIIGRVTRDLRHERRRQKHLPAEIDLHCQPGEKCVPVESLKPKAVIGAVVFGRNAHRECRGNTVGQPRPQTDRR